METDHRDHGKPATENATEAGLQNKSKSWGFCGMKKKQTFVSSKKATVLEKCVNQIITIHVWS